MDTFHVVYLFLDFNWFIAALLRSLFIKEARFSSYFFFILEVHVYLKHFERFLRKLNTFLHYFDRLQYLDQVRLFAEGFILPIFYSFLAYSREKRTENWKNQFMTITNSCFKYASLMKTSWSNCEHYVNWCTYVTFMASFPCDICRGKKVTKI